ncbi:DUF3124 domain-containing protein [Adhaeretor mobilis]|uniref:DUF3124 domain-containing protein n=1 Tax=Adhaeretor mobilis TaxID=1930276 RepID=A0A517N0Q9_9BACT|nr:DUF3124 domain-containing protein [Adhaeretor mobilis]QDT00608.1 hypothetical protein HG15A2_39470 [Adhaeretor mobilis]
MAKDRETEFDAFMRRFWWFVMGGFLALIVPLSIYGYFLNRRLDSFADALHFREPDPGDDAAVELELGQLLTHPVRGQTVYVPAYSHVYHEDGKPHLLTITLSVRNTSLEHGIVVTSVRYYDTSGKLTKKHLDKPLRLGPLASTEFLVEREDTSGGSGANFLVQWVADQVVSEPVIEAVMIDTSSQQGISFARSGTVIKEQATESQSDAGDMPRVPAHD